MEKCVALFLIARLISASPISDDVSGKSLPAFLTTKEKPLDNTVTYDQRQTGRFNIRVNIKDVAVILQSESVLSAGDMDDVNYDYDYDYDHLTVKPIGIWGPPPPAPVDSSIPPGSGVPNSVTPPSMPAVNGSHIIFINSTTDNAEAIPVPAESSTTLMLSSEAPVETLGGTDSTTLEAFLEPESTTKLNRTTHKYAWNGDLEEIPVEVIIEPILKNKQRKNVTGTQQRPKQYQKNKSNEAYGDKKQRGFGMQQLVKLLSMLSKNTGSDDTENYEAY